MFTFVETVRCLRYCKLAITATLTELRVTAGTAGSSGRANFCVATKGVIDTKCCHWTDLADCYLSLPCRLLPFLTLQTATFPYLADCYLSLPCGLLPFLTLRTATFPYLADCYLSLPLWEIQMQNWHHTVHLALSQYRPATDCSPLSLCRLSVRTNDSRSSLHISIITSLLQHSGRFQMILPPHTNLRRPRVLPTSEFCCALHC